MPPDLPSVAGYRVRAPLLQKKLGKTLCYKNFGRVGRTISFLVEANNGTKQNVKTDIVEPYIFLLFCPLPITPMMWKQKTRHKQYIKKLNYLWPLKVNHVCNVCTQIEKVAIWAVVFIMKTTANNKIMYLTQNVVRWFVLINEIQQNTNTVWSLQLMVPSQTQYCLMSCLFHLWDASMLS